MVNEPTQPGVTTPQVAQPQPTTVSTGTSPAGAVSSGSVAAPTASVASPTTPTTPATPTPVVVTGAPAPQTTTPVQTSAQAPTPSPTGGVISATQTAAAQASTTHVALSTPKKETYPWYQFYKGEDGMQKLMMLAVIVIGYIIFAYSGYFVGTAVGRASVPPAPEVFCSAATILQSAKENSSEDKPATDSAELIGDSEPSNATDSAQLDESADESANEADQASTSSATTKPPMR